MIPIGRYPNESVRHRNFAFVVLFSLVLALLLTRDSAAQEISDAARDPQGARQAVRLREAFEAAAANSDDPTFLKVFDENPNLTRRAFLPLVEQWENETDPERQELAANLYSEVAALALERFGDYIPNLIIDTINEENPDSPGLCERYAEFLIEQAKTGPNLSAKKLRSYDPYANTYTIIETAADYKPEDLASGILFNAKGLRFTTAFILENFPLVAREQQTLPLILERLKAIGDKNEVAKNYIQLMESDDFQDVVLSYYNVCSELESGLLDRAITSMQPELDDPELFYWRTATLYLAAARVAYEQARLPVLKRMLALARDEIAQDKEVSRSHLVLEFIVRTAEYRQRRLEGFDPTDQEIFAEFDKAWSALDSYRPMVEANVDATWLEGRHATRFWLDELARASNGQEACLTRMARDWQRWWDQTLDGQAQLETRDDHYTRMAYIDSLYILGPNFFDQATYRWAKFPRWQVDPKELAWVEGALGHLPETIHWMVEDQSGDAFPPYDLTSAGLLPEMMARCKLVGARAKGLSIKARVDLLEESAALIARATYPSSKAEHLIAIGQEFKKCEAPEKAVECWTKALELTKEIPLAKPAFVAPLLLAREYYNGGYYEKACQYADLATERLEQISALVGTRSRDARNWSQELSAITRLAAQAYIGAKSPEKALAALTRGTHLIGAAMQVEGNRDAREDVEEFRRQQRGVDAVAEQVARLESQPASPIRDDLLAQTRQLLADNRAEYLGKSRELRQKHASLYAQALKFDPLNLPALQSQLPANVAVLQFFPADDTLYTFLVTRDAFRLRSVSISSQELDKLLLSYQRGIRRHSSGDTEVEAQARKLYDILMAPSAEDLKDKSSLVLIPTGRLHGLPFACLADEHGRPLVETWRLLELAKPTDLTRLSRVAGEPIENVVAFANASGDLPAAQAEGKAITAMFPKARLFETEQATKANFFSYGSGAQVLHLATHGEWNLDDSLKNYLTMADSEKVAQEEIFQLTLDNTSMVILSACNTAMGEGSEGGYMASLAEAFWLAGSRSVVASLWAVDDGSTALLMETFYQHLKAGDDKAEALRAAQLAVRSQPRFQHPYYWAGFVLFGERR